MKKKKIELKPHHIIHKHLKRISPKGVKKAKSLFKFRYPKLLILITCIILAYFLFQNDRVLYFVSKLESLSYLGIFIAGILVAIGFTAPFAIGFLVVIEHSNILLSSIIAGLGASIGDILIFKIIRFSFLNEFKEIEKTKTVSKIRKIFREDFSVRVRHYFLYIFAGIFLASPLPDEVGVTLLAGLTTIKQKTLWIISFLLHTAAIYLILLFF